MKIQAMMRILIIDNDEASGECPRNQVEEHRIRLRDGSFRGAGIGSVRRRDD